MKQWRYKISVKERTYKNTIGLPFHFEWLIEDIKECTKEEIQNILIEQALIRLQKIAQIHHSVCSFEFVPLNEENEKYSYSYVNIWIE